MVLYCDIFVRTFNLISGKIYADNATARPNNEKGDRKRRRPACNSLDRSKVESLSGVCIVCDVLAGNCIYLEALPLLSCRMPPTRRVDDVARCRLLQGAVDSGLR